MLAGLKSRSIRPSMLTLEDRLNPGGGTFDAVTGTFNFSVSVQFDAKPEEMEEIKEAFQIASDIIHDATDEQHRFGTVTIVNNGGESAEAEVYLIRADGISGAAPRPGYGQRGQHAKLYMQTNGQMYAATPTNPYGGGYVVAHEFGHLVYGLGDEYEGPRLPATENAAGEVISPILKTENADPEFGTAGYAEAGRSTYSLMDDFFARGRQPQTGDGRETYTLNEFSVRINHDRDRDTYQTYENRESDWETIAKSKYPAIAPRSVPKDDTPPSRPVTFITNAVNTPYTVIAVDESDSLRRASALSLAS